MNVESFVADCRRWGLARALFMRLMSRLDRHAGLHLYRLYARPLSASHPPMVTDPGISLRVARPDELYEAARDPGLDLSPDFIRDALARADRAFVAFDGDELVAYTWRTATAAPHADGLWVRVEAPRGYGYKTFTRQSHRGRRLAGAVSFFSDAYGLERGLTAVVDFVEVSNYASRSVERSVGCRAIGYVGYLKCFGRAFPFRSPAAREIGFAFFPERKDKRLSYFEEDAEVPDQRAE